MYLSKLTVNVYSRDFRRDHADLRQMHRTVMSAYPDLPEDTPARQSQAVLWRLDSVHRGFVQYVQSNSKPDWSRLAADYLTEPAQVRSLQPLLDAITPGRRFAFRLVGNPTRAVVGRADHKQPMPDDGKRPRGKRTALIKPEDQIAWLVRKGSQHGFVVPTGHNGQPDVAPSPCLTQTGQRRLGDRGPITVQPVRFEGHLIVTEVDTFRSAVQNGIGRAKAYGCGLISLAPARTA